MVPKCHSWSSGLNVLISADEVLLPTLCNPTKVSFKLQLYIGRVDSVKSLNPVRSYDVYNLGQRWMKYTIDVWRHILH